MIRVKTREEILVAPYLFQRDIERALGIPQEQARIIFRKAKQIDREAGIAEISPRKVRRASVEKACGIRFEMLGKPIEKKAARGRAA